MPQATQINEYFTILEKAINECLTGDDLMELDPNLIATSKSTDTSYSTCASLPNAASPSHHQHSVMVSSITVESMI